MSYILASTAFQIINAIVFIVALVVFIFTFVLDFDNKVVPAAVTGFLMLLTAVFFFYGQAHFVVSPNRTALVVSLKSGQPIGNMRPAGVQSRPMWTSAVYTYPAQKSYQWCPELTPSTKGGAGVTVTYCWTMDASSINWGKQYQKYNGNVDTITTGWQNELQPIFAVAIKQFVPRDLTDRRDDVAAAVSSITKSWFEDNGITVKNHGVKNWDFTSAEMSKAYEAALVSQTKIDVANAELEAAKIQEETAKVRFAACQAAGMLSEQSCNTYLQYTWLSSLANPPANLVVSMGGSVQPAVTFPVAPAAASTPTK